MAGVIKWCARVTLAMATACCCAAAQANAVRSSYTDEPACVVKSVQKEGATYESYAKTSRVELSAVTQLDSKGVYQVYTTNSINGQLRCISCDGTPGAPRLDRNKPMVSWHPSGQWLVVGVEETVHDNMWMPDSWKRGLLQSGIWLNMWITTPDGDRWYQVTDFKKPANGPSDGFVGAFFTPNGEKAAWAEIVDGNIFLNRFGVWKLFLADFVVKPDGTPALVNTKDITPVGARWVEPGSFSPDGKHMLISADIGMGDAQGQDQFVLNTATKEVVNLTNSPDVWDEHGVYSLDGRKISFMSSLPYRNDSTSNKVSSLRTEILLMDADGGHLQQITHFNTPGYSESQAANTVAALAGFIGDGSQMYATVMTTDGTFQKTNWTITFEGRCGASPVRPRRPARPL